MYKNNSAPWNNTVLWHYLGTKCLDLGVKIIVPQGINQGNTVYFRSHDHYGGPVNQVDILLKCFSDTVLKVANTPICFCLY